MTLDVLDLKVSTLIRRKSRNVFGLPMERADVEQELRAAVIGYCNATPEDKRTRQAIAVTINQRLYKLIREHSQFEGCSERSRQIRKMLSRPCSLNQPVQPRTHTGENKGDDITLLGLLHSESDNQGDQVMLADFVRNFRKELTEIESTIFNLMIEGVNKPRFICKELYGHQEEKACKIISKHMMSIKRKFVQAWREDYGKIIRF